MQWLTGLHGDSEGLGCRPGGCQGDLKRRQRPYGNRLWLAVGIPGRRSHQYPKLAGIPVENESPAVIAGDRRRTGTQKQVGCRNRTSGDRIDNRNRALLDGCHLVRGRYGFPDAAGGNRGAVAQWIDRTAGAGVIGLIERGQGERHQLGEVLGQEEQAALGELVVDGVDGTVIDEDDTQQALVAGITLFVGEVFPI